MPPVHPLFQVFVDQGGIGLGKVGKVHRIGIQPACNTVEVIKKAVGKERGDGRCQLGDPLKATVKCLIGRDLVL